MNVMRLIYERNIIKFSTITLFYISKPLRYHTSLLYCTANVQIYSLQTYIFYEVFRSPSTRQFLRRLNIVTTNKRREQQVFLRYANGSTGQSTTILHSINGRRGQSPFLHSNQRRECNQFSFTLHKMERGQLDFLHSPQAEERNICFPTHSTNHRKEHQLTYKLQQLSN
jgi:hypothetical protein